ncbi:MAG TPA: hypothetical protein VGD37_40705 [Kofleriaceae bacterium]
MTRYEELLTAVTSNIDDDAPRLAFAAHIAGSDPERARFIEDQIARAKARRVQRGYVDAGDHPLLRTHGAEWSRMIAKYARHWTFDRGFVAKITIEPYLFLEYGEWLLVNYPIQMVELCKPDDGAFPVSELAASPLLARLEALVIREVRLEQSELEQLIASPHLARMLHLVVGCERASPALYERIAASPDLRKLLVLSIEPDGPGQRFADTGRDDMQGRAVHAWTDVGPAGKALEAKHGYVPWLHPEQNWCEPLDAAWFVAQGVLPAKPPGSPVT